MKLLFLDTETTGTDSDKHGLIQVAGAIAIDRAIKETFNFKIKPFPNDAIEDEALKVNGVTREDLASPDRLEPEVAHVKILDMFGRYVSKFDRQDKFHLIGYNAQFDDEMLRAFWRKCGDTYYGSWIFWPTVDIAQIAGLRLMKDRWRMPDFKLMTVALHLGIDLTNVKAHDALDDIRVTMNVLKKLTTDLDVFMDLPESLT